MGRLTFDDCDDRYDVNHSSSTLSKRKRLLRGNSEPKTRSHSSEEVVENFKSGGRTVDEDYMYFLKCVLEGNELRWLAEGEESSDEESDGDIDPDCKVFIDNLLEDGKSYLLRIVNDDGTEEFIKYEAEDEPDEECASESSGELWHGKKAESREVRKDFRDVKSADKADKAGKERRDGERGSPSRRELRSDKKGKKIGVKKDFCNSRSIGEDEKPSLLCEHAPPPQREYDSADDTADSSYRWFLKNMQKEGDHFVLVRSDGKRLVYEEDDRESSSDSEVLVMDNDPYCCKGDNTPFVHSRVFDTSMERVDQPCSGNPTRDEHSQFRENLMGILQRPYNQEELEKLWQEVKERKPMEGRRNLRSAIKSFPKDEYSKSYLDHYKDLKRKIDAVELDRPKKLNILRGFFFWLQNQSDEACILSMVLPDPYIIIDIDVLFIGERCCGKN
ncbi:hypothetical protein RJ640_014091 [Escallonia rubra]|uniref:Uncharacterized protein n=1 Tax=Escallonia rubra TaxID=112253 RepID=A0AA88URG1_9ASTE|nr:hypothetical protein RJ640_014091 [Escallonia rubra]